jgi:hypothetical protein
MDILGDICNFKFEFCVMYLALLGCGCCKLIKYENYLETIFVYHMSTSVF